AGLVTPTATGNFDVTKMYNVDGGSNYWSVTAQISKNFTPALSAMLAYTRSGGENYGDGSGDQIINLWSLPATAGSSNIASLGYNGNILPNRVIGSLSYRKEWLGNLATSISMFYEGAIQGRFSYTYGGDYNRDNQFNDLIYVPRDASEITFVPLTITVNNVARVYSAQEQSDAFFAYVNQDEYLSSRKGQYAERNGAKLPWRNRVDLKLTQEVFKNVGKSKNSFQFTMDVFNFGNLLNKNWGTADFINNSQILVPTNMASVNATTKPTFRMAQRSGDLVRSSFATNETLSSTYYMQFGVRYNFN
ncbi:MAG: TonB-dependent receptor, partial [Bacteroidia bacterium]